MCSSLYILLYPYPYQSFAFGISFLILIIFVLAFIGFYFLVTWKMRPQAKSIFQFTIVFTAVVLFILFFVELTFTLITIHQVDLQLGFRYATPETPEGELFEITKVEQGKTMDYAGLKLYDQVQMHNCDQLYELLIGNQGKEVIIPIMRNNQEIKVMVNVPKLHVPFAKVSFLIL